MDDLDYVEFSETYLMPSFSAEVCILSFSLSFLFSFTFLHMVIFNYDDYFKVRLVLLLVVLLPLPVYLGQSMLMAPMTLLRSVLGRNPNVMGYPFLEVTRVVSSLSFLSCLLLSCISQNLF